MYKIIIIAIVFLISISDIFTQVKGGEQVFNPDTVFVFKSPRKLLTLSEKQSTYTEAAALDLLFSNSGFAVGGSYQKYLNEGFTAGIRFFISGARNSDEYESYNYKTGEREVWNKRNRLFLMPLTLNARQFLFQSKLHKSFKPYVSAGAGVAFILSTPYRKEFFNAFSYSVWYGRPAASLGLGAVIGSGPTAYMSVNIDYYYIPFGGKGLESIWDQPIKDFGGVFLSLSIGGLF